MLSYFIDLSNHYVMSKQSCRVAALRNIFLQNHRRVDDRSKCDLSNVLFRFLTIKNLEHLLDRVALFSFLALGLSSSFFFFVYL